MKDNEYNRLGRLYQFINNNYSQRTYNYGGFNGNYKTYQIADVQFPEDTLNLIEKLMQVRVNDFYDLEYLKSHGYPENFYNEELVKKSKNEYGFHYQLSTILFHYILNQIKSSAREFLEIIDSDEFSSAFSYWTKKDEYLFQYPSYMHKEIFRYIDSRIEFFHLFHHQCNFLSDISYDDGGNTIYKIKRIESCLNNLNGFDLDNIDLKSL